MRVAAAAVVVVTVVFRVLLIQAVAVEVSFDQLGHTSIILLVHSF
jgi:hypothetical protein